MTSKTLITLLICVTIGCQSFAQDVLSFVPEQHAVKTEPSTGKLTVFEFPAFSRDYELNAITKEVAGDHLFGELVARKLYLLDKKYTTQEEIGPGNPQTNTMIQKPVIYNAVKHSEKYLKKSVKRKDLTGEQASVLFNKVLDVALNIRDAETSAFESAIETAPDDAAKLELFTKGVNLIY